MTVHFESETEKELGFDAQALAERTIVQALDQLGCPYEADVNVLLTESGPVHEMNLQFRGIDATTDVLSFPMIDFPSEGDFDFLETQAPDDCFHPESGELLLGDIVINADRVLSQAQEYGHSPMREYAFLITHSVLHLCGFDHMQEDEEKRMRTMQETILTAMGITRDPGAQGV